jgi:hypothetical protein
MLAVVALGVVAALVVMATRPSRRAVVPLIDVHRDAAPPMEEDAGGEVAVTPAPPLASDQGRRRTDAGASDPCQALRRARERDASAATIDRLAEKCTAAGGEQ